MRLITFALTGSLCLAACGEREKPLRIMQRSEASIAPGITLQVGDIELGGGAKLTVLGKGSRLAHTYARAGEVVPFEFEGKKWEVEVVRLENHLTHEDFVHVRVRRK